MKRLSINTPIWKTRSIGIASRLLNDDVEINILYRDIYGNKLYPHTYFIKKETAKQFPVQYVKGIKLHIVPISELETKQ